jgi:hypothetical protein
MTCLLWQIAALIMVASGNVVIGMMFLIVGFTQASKAESQTVKKLAIAAALLTIVSAALSVLFGH